MREVFIVSFARTPIGSLGGVLASVNTVELGKIAVQAAMERAKVNGDMVDEVILGNVLQANVGQAPAQQVSIAAGIRLHRFRPGASARTYTEGTRCHAQGVDGGQRGTVASLPVDERDRNHG